jgi:phosphotransferase system HPr-like phosphotransfer protein
MLIVLVKIKSVINIFRWEVTPMFTAILNLPAKRADALGPGLPFLKIRNRFQSSITIQRGNSKPFDISIDEQLKELAANKSADLRIVIKGKDEMEAACNFIDFFNHGVGI